MRYNTTLSKSIDSKVNKVFGVFWTSDLAQRLGKNVSSIHYQLKRLVKERKLLTRKTKGYRFFVKPGDLLRCRAIKHAWNKICSKAVSILKDLHTFISNQDESTETDQQAENISEKPDFET